VLYKNVPIGGTNLAYYLTGLKAQLASSQKWAHVRINLKFIPSLGELSRMGWRKMSTGMKGHVAHEQGSCIGQGFDKCLSR
jgi:hypothetical protein